MQDHRWELLRSRVDEIKTASHHELVFLCGSVQNDTEEWDLFDVAICLTIDEGTLRERLESRTNNAFGKAPAELAAILSSRDLDLDRYRALGAVIIESTRSITEVADQVLAAAGIPQR